MNILPLLLLLLSPLLAAGQDGPVNAVLQASGVKEKYSFTLEYAPLHQTETYLINGSEVFYKYGLTYTVDNRLRSVALMSETPADFRGSKDYILSVVRGAFGEQKRSDRQRLFEAYYFRKGGQRAVVRFSAVLDDDAYNCVELMLEGS